MNLSAAPKECVEYMINNSILDVLFDGIHRNNSECFECAVWASANMIGSVGSYVKAMFEKKGLYDLLLNNYEFHRLDVEIENSMSLFISNSFKDHPFISNEVVS